MGIFDFLFGAKGETIYDPDALRAELFSSAESGDHKRFEGICRRNRKLIRANFADWQKPPRELQSDPEAMNRYANGLILVAEFFASNLGTPDLMQRLMGKQADNPIMQWQEGLQYAQARMDELAFAEAVALLSDLIEKMRKVTGSGVDTYLPIALGRLGECRFQNGRAAEAVPLFQEALALCQATGDADGVAAYCGNLYEACRYLGEQDQAAEYCAQLAESYAQLGQADMAARYNKQAEVVRAGEPLNRVVGMLDGRRYEVDDLPVGGDLQVQFVFERNRITLQPASVLTQQGEALGGEGRYDEALASFHAAAEADPYDPHARYLAGFTLTHLRRYAEAVEQLRAADALAPGWFHGRADAWLAERLAAEAYTHEVFVALHQLEDGSMPPAQKAELAGQLAAQCPDLPHAHYLHGKNLSATAQQEAAKEAFHRGLGCDPEPDIKTRLLLEAGVLENDAQKREALLREACELGGNLTAAATAAVALKLAG